MTPEEKIDYVYRRVRLLSRVLAFAVFANILLVAALIVGGVLVVNTVREKIDDTTGQLDQRTEEIKQQIPTTDDLRNSFR